MPDLPVVMETTLEPSTDSPYRRAFRSLSDPAVTVGHMPAPLPIQGTLDDLGTPLHQCTFVVVDLETTGGSPRSCAITEIGAVKVRGGEVIGEFQTLVNPGEAIPVFISLLTGITDTMVASAPRLGTALPAFMDFAAGSILVAHNAGFDTGFLKAGCHALGIPWPGFPVIDTVLLARHLVPRDEAPNRRLGTLAGLFGAQTTPDHRALHDARATVDVLHALIERVGNQGVRTLEELSSYSSRVTPEQRRKRFLADGLPDAAGVYVFKDAAGRPLYVGTSRNIRARVRTYFTASEHRSRMAHMVAAAVTVTPIVCQTDTEARIREVRLIGESQPRFNRRSKRKDTVVWVRLTDEVYPRLSIVRKLPADGSWALGPLRSRRQADECIAAVHEVISMRQCTTAIPRHGTGSACMLADLGRCDAPCLGQQDPQDYARVVAGVRALFDGTSRDLLARLRTRMTHLAATERFEEAGVLRDRTATLARSLTRTQRLGPLRATRQIIAARRRPQGGWELMCIRFGRLAGASVTPRGADPRPYVESLAATSEFVRAPTPGALAASIEESEILLSWLESPGVRMVEVDGVWTCPVVGAAGVPGLDVSTSSRSRLGA